MRLAVFFLVIAGVTKFVGAEGQALLILDAETHQGIEGALVEIQNGNTTRKAVTGFEGKIELKNLTIPFVITIHHINYPVYQDTLSSVEPVYLTQVAQTLEEFVITGQYVPQAASNSLFKIRTIDNERIRAMANISLDQILRQELNIDITNDPATGTSGMSLMGIEGRNVKFLIDGVPFAGRTGNSTDLGQLNLNNIDRIEVVEGPMAVNFGTNALAGVINIITRKPLSNSFNINAFIHEETIGKEYAVTEGIHQQAINAEMGITDKYATWFDLQRNYFGGFQGISPGRSREWLPKTQWKGSGKLQYKGNKVRSFYKFDWLDEKIDSPAEPASLFNPVALDEVYHTTRLTHIAEIEKPITRGSMSFIGSRSDYERIKTQYAHNLSTGDKPLSLAEGAQDTSTFRNWNFRGTVKQIRSAHLGFEAGFEMLLDKTSGGRILNNEEKVQNDLAGFLSTEIYIRKFTLRPAGRLTYNSSFGWQAIPSFNIKYAPGDNSTFRFAYGRGFRSPSLRELYFEFIDTNHNVRGNENLNPETGDHFSLSYFQGSNGSKVKMESDVSIFYNNIRDQIEFGQSPLDPQLTTYLNLSKFESAGITFSEQIIYHNLTAKIGFGYTGRKSSIEESFSDSKFLFSSEVISGIEYLIPWLNIKMNVSYKYTGKIARYFYESDSTGSAIITKGITDDFHWMDLGASRSFGRYLNLSFGVRNLFNHQRIDSTVPGSSVHSSGARIIGYGRSYYLRLNFSINSNKTNKNEKN